MVDPVDEVLESRLGQTVGGRWNLTGLLGQGGMAAVYAATDHQGNIAAVKLLHPEMGIRRDIRERFLREASVMTQICHPGMVTIYEQGTDNDTAYLAMELLDGEVLTARLRRLGPLPPTEVLHLLDQLLDVLIVAHGLGVIHRDLKPENLFLTREGRLKVLDFGLARLMYDVPGGFRTRTGAALGTLPYMAPEQALGRRNEVDARTDLFAVGATAFRLLAGRRIHEAPSDAELLMLMASEPAPKLLTAAPLVPVPLALIVDRALCFPKASRYPDATAMQNDVRAVLAGGEPPYATAEQTRDEFPTQVDRMAPRGGAQPRSSREVDAQPQRSQRQAATVVMVSQKAEAADANTRVLPPTASMRAEQLPAPAPRHIAPTALDPTRPDAAAAMAPSSPLAAAQAPLPAPTSAGSLPLLVQLPAFVSPRAVNRQRKRTLVVGLLLLGVLLIVTTALGLWLFATPWAGPTKIVPVTSTAPLRVQGAAGAITTTGAESVPTPARTPTLVGAKPEPRSQAKNTTSSNDRATEDAQATATAAKPFVGGPTPPAATTPSAPKRGAEVKEPAAPTAVPPALPPPATTATASTAPNRGNRGRGNHRHEK